MARISERLPENVPGGFFVDSTCIDCDLCRQLAPQTFAESRLGSRSFVFQQPASDEQRHRALMALVACPTASIGTVTKSDAAGAVKAFPEPIAGPVFFCGFASASSFGASSYFIQRPGGNVLVDSPRAARPLMRRLGAMGGVRWMFLSHRDDVADHEAFHRAFGCERVLHRDDIGRGTADVEHPVAGLLPVSLDSELTVIPVPGHTPGSAALLYREFLFTGDHLWGTDDGLHLSASRSVCWYSWPEQVRSIERLLDFEFEWVLPGHGRRFQAANPAAMRAELERLLELFFQPAQDRTLHAGKAAGTRAG
jgi:glyoxylase-like metal-dependent hydrolase (beta-lactamase superfamily II)/ferredoxin